MKAELFSSHEAAAKADTEYYKSLTGEERLQILLELVEQYGGRAEYPFERVYRLTTLKES